MVNEAKEVKKDMSLQHKMSKKIMNVKKEFRQELEELK